MIKKVEIIEEIVMCDLCGADTGFTGEQGYAKQPKHFCKTHREAEEIWKSLQGYPRSQITFFEEAKTGKQEVEEEERPTPMNLHSSITKMG